MLTVQIFYSRKVAEVNLSGVGGEILRTVDRKSKGELKSFDLYEAEVLIRPFGRSDLSSFDLRVIVDFDSMSPEKNDPRVLGTIAQQVRFAIEKFFALRDIHVGVTLRSCLSQTSANMRANTLTSWPERKKRYEEEHLSPLLV